jgi:predicted O-methyltransferase YrrM
MEVTVSNRYDFTQDWFSGNIETWQEYLGPLAGQPGLRFLEIGCFEGRTTVWLLKHILTDERARITCIDTFAGSVEYWQRGLSGSPIEQRFDHNVRVSPAPRKVEKIKERSCVALRTLPFESFDVVYVDGSHLAPDVLEDAVLAFPLLKPGGLMIFDDYEWSKLPGETRNPKLGIDAFLRVYAEQHELLLKAYQVILRKRAS